MNWGVPQIQYHTFSWDNMVVTGTVATNPCDVWVDDNWVGSSLYQEVEPGKFYGYNAFSTIQNGINAVCVGGTVNVYAGTYPENLASWKNMEIIKSLSLIGAGSGSSIVQVDKQNGVEIRGTSLTVLIQGLTFTKKPANTYAASFNLRIAETASTFTSLILRDVEVSYANGPNVNLGTNGVYNQVIIEDCNFHHAGTWGLYSQGQLPNGMTVTNSHFDYNGLLMRVMVLDLILVVTVAHLTLWLLVVRLTTIM